MKKKIYNFIIIIITLLIMFSTNTIGINKLENIEHKTNNFFIKQNNEIVFTEADDDLGYQYVINLNKDTQDRANKIKTQKAIDKLRIKKMRYMRLNKDTTKLINKIKELEKTPLVDKNVIQYNYFDIISYDTEIDDIEKIKDGRSLKSDPVKAGRKTALFLGIFKNIGIASITAGWLWNEDIWVAITTGIILLFTMFFTAIAQYWLSRYYVRNRHKKYLKMKLEKRKACRNYINNNVIFEIKEDIML